MAISFGSDPEFMLVKDGKYYSAIDVVNGNIFTRIKSRGHEFYWDNVLAECAIKPSRSREEAVANFRECFQIYADMVRPYTLVPQSSQVYPESELNCREARTSGCGPDMCAYKVKWIEPISGLLSTNLRSGGGHVHVGHEVLQNQITNPHPFTAALLLDLFLGIPSLFMDHDPTSKARKKLYGQAGRMRPKPYGLEYRCLSNFWLASPKLVELVYDIVDFVVGLLTTSQYEAYWLVDVPFYQKAAESRLKRAFKCVGYDAEAVRKCLSKNDKVRGEAFFAWALAGMPSTLANRIREACQPVVYDFYTEWSL